MEFTKDIQFNNKPVANQSIKLSYSGFLSHSAELSVVYGFGEAWEYTSEAKMEKTENGFVAKIDLLDFDTFNFCFRNNDNEWDNNSNCNYISPILPSIKGEVTSLFQELLTCNQENVKEETFNIDALIEEILEPILAKPIETEDSTSFEITTKPVDLSLELRNALSQIESKMPDEELIEYSTLDEILSGTVIGETPIELLEENSPIDELIENISVSEELPSVAAIQAEDFEEEKALIKTKDAFIISPRQLSRFYLFKKRIKLAFYKALVKIPKMIFGTEE